jgi:hypothetical protein
MCTGTCAVRAVRRQHGRHYTGEEGAEGPGSMPLMTHDHPCAALTTYRVSTFGVGSLQIWIVEPCQAS